MFYFYKIFLFLLFLLTHPAQEIIIDSNMTFEEALAGKTIPQKIKDQLQLVNVDYYSFDGREHQGQLLIDKELKSEIEDIFRLIKKEKFPINKVVPVSRYKWNDSLSMADNNTSAFNFRSVKGTRKLSAHSYGRAIDINPLLNPQFKKGKIFPHSGSYNTENPGTLFLQSPVVKAFRKHGWSWGGRWKSTKDYMHFEHL